MDRDGVLAALEQEYAAAELFVNHGNDGSGYVRLNAEETRLELSSDAEAPLPAAWLDQGMLWIALVLTIISGAYYFVVTQRRLFPRRSTSEP